MHQSTKQCRHRSFLGANLTDHLRKQEAGVSWLKRLLGLGEAGLAPSPPLGERVLGERVLVADPSMTIQKVIELTLGSEGYSVAVAVTGDDAIASLATTPPTVVLASADLPGKSGLQVCEAVRRRPELAGTVVIILRGAFEPPLDERRLRVAGADGVLTKPFEPVQLIEQIQALRLKRSKALT